MDKIVRRVRMAERQVARRNKRRQDLRYRVILGQRREDIKRMTKQAGFEINQAIKARHEDLELGPLAPRREARPVDDWGNYWGSISMERAMLRLKLTKKEQDARAAWAGGSQYLCLAPGDRVVVTEGPFKGKIAPIASIKKDAMAVELDGNVGLVNLTVPDPILEDTQSPVQVAKSSIPISAVRLVHPITDPATGTTRDVIIRELKPVGITHDRPTRKVFYSRLVPGLNIRIPWPKVPPTEHEDHVVDTLRLEVEERTFVPTLLRPPMPDAVLDELRNKYSKFRTRHTPEYIALVEAREAEKKAAKQGADKMLLPVQEYNRKMREERRERGQPELTEEMLEKIGEIIVKNRLARSGAQAAAAGGKTDADADVAKVQKAVEELSIGGDAQGPPGGDQPTA